MNKKRAKKLLLYFVLIFCALIYILPISMLFMNAFKINENELVKDLSTFRAFLPVGELGFGNIINVFTQLSIGRFFMNSLIITLASVGIGLLVNSMLGYALARLSSL